MATIDQIHRVQELLGINNEELLKFSTIQNFVERAVEDDQSGGDDECVALLACSKIVRSAMWQDVTRQADGTTIKTTDTFAPQLEDRLSRLGVDGMVVGKDHHHHHHYHYD